MTTSALLSKIIQNPLVFAINQAWFGYDCKNKIMEMNRAVTFVGDQFEVQINEPRSATQRHSHGHLMDVLFLNGGYSMLLNGEPVTFFAGDRYHMDAMDDHEITDVYKPCLTLAVHSRQTNWHETYPRKLDGQKTSDLVVSMLDALGFTIT